MATEWRTSRTWRALAAMRIGPPGAALTFAARLARENGWSPAHAAAVVTEYKRFLYLAADSPHPVTPSDEVDQAWHLHLAYSRHYWDVLCATILRRPLHHGPTEGGEAESTRYFRQYEDTLARYRQVFGSEPPASIWPDPETRFAARHIRIDRRRYWLLPRLPAGRGALVCGSALAAGCSAAASKAGGIDVTTLILVVMTLGIVSFVVMELRKRDRDGSCGGACGAGGCGAGGGWGDGSDAGGCGGGGCGGCGG